MKPEQAVVVLLAQQEIIRQQSLIEKTLEDCEAPDTGEFNIRQRFNTVFEEILSMCEDPTPYDDKRFIDGHTPEVPINVNKIGEDVTLYLQFGLIHDIEGQSIAAVWALSLQDQQNQFIEKAAPQPNGFINEDALNNLEWSLSSYRDAIVRLTPIELHELGFPKEFISRLMANSGKTFLAP
jgi:hypothetical protein